MEDLLDFEILSEDALQIPLDALLSTHLGGKVVISKATGVSKGKLMDPIRSKIRGLVYDSSLYCPACDGKVDYLKSESVEDIKNYACPKCGNVLSRWKQKRMNFYCTVVGCGDKAIFTGEIETIKDSYLLLLESFER